MHPGKRALAEKANGDAPGYTLVQGSNGRQKTCPPSGRLGGKVEFCRLGGLIWDFISYRDDVPHDDNLKIIIVFLCTE